MRPRRLMLFAWLLLITVAVPATATVLRVPQQYSSIALALTEAAAGDSVLIDPGTYYESDLDVPAGVHLSGTSPSPELTVIDAQQNGRVLTITGSDTRIASLRLTGGQDPQGGGIHVGAGNFIAIESVVIDGCEANAGGGVFVRDANVTLLDCVVTGNTAWTSGGGIHAVDSQYVGVHRSLLHDNTAGAMGGAWYSARSTLELISATVVGNQAPQGAEGTAFGAQPVAYSFAIVAEHDAASITELLFGDLASRTDNSCCLRWTHDDDAWPGYLAEQLADDGRHNVEAYPMFCRGDGGWSEYFGLRAGSPAIVDGCGRLGAFDVACDAVAVPEEAPRVDQLAPARPNPFNPSTVIAFAVADGGPVELTIYGLDGRRVATLVDESLAAGRHEATWRGQDDTGRRVASGVYLARLVTDRGHHATRLTLVK